MTSYPTPLRNLTLYLNHMTQQKPPHQSGSDKYELQAARAEIRAVILDQSHKVPPETRALLRGVNYMLGVQEHNTDAIHDLSKSVDDRVGQLERYNLILLTMRYPLIAIPLWLFLALVLLSHMPEVGPMLMVVVGEIHKLKIP